VLIIRKRRGYPACEQCAAAVVCGSLLTSFLRRLELHKRLWHKRLQVSQETQGGTSVSVTKDSVRIGSNIDFTD